MALKDFSNDELIDLLAEQVQRLRDEDEQERLMAYQLMQRIQQLLYERVLFPELDPEKEERAARVERARKANRKRAQAIMARRGWQPPYPGVRL